MTIPLHALTAAPPTAPTTAATSTAASASQSDLHKVATEFEAMLLRQLLGAAKMGGEGGYAEMAVESLSDGITQSGGVGLARQIEAALSDQIRMHAGSLSHSSPTESGRSPG